MIEEALDALETTIDEAQEEVLRRRRPARVINLLDPLMLGRVQVQLPSIDALDLQPVGARGVPDGRACCTATTSSPTWTTRCWWRSSTATSTRRTSSAACGRRSRRRRCRRRCRRSARSARWPATRSCSPSGRRRSPCRPAPTAPAALPTPPSPTGPHHTITLSPAGIQVDVADHRHAPGRARAA